MAKKKALSLEQFKAYASQLTKVKVPSLDGCVYMKKPTTAHALGFSKAKEQGQDLQDMTVQMVYELVVDQDGAQIFGSPEDVGLLPMDVFTDISQAMTTHFASEREPEEMEDDKPGSEPSTG